MILRPSRWAHRIQQQRYGISSTTRTRTASSLSLSEADGAEAATSASSVDVDTPGTEDRRRPISFYVDTVFPIRVGIWDVRYLLAQVEKESLLKSIQDKLPSAKDARFDGFRVDAVEAREKDGGAFVKCSYLLLNPTSLDGSKELQHDDGTAHDIAKEVIAAYNAKGERPWYSFRTSQAHLVKVGVLPQVQARDAS
jgi:hypothetical protein